MPHTRIDIKHNDTVKVITGRDKGKQGRVLRVFPDKGKILVEHVMMVKKHLRPTQKSKGGIAEQESAVSISKVQLVCSTCGPVRTRAGRGSSRTSASCRTITLC